jgi:hypothetical protein
MLFSSLIDKQSGNAMRFASNNDYADSFAVAVRTAAKSFSLILAPYLKRFYSMFLQSCV